MSTFQEFSIALAQALADGRYADAHAMLSENLRKEKSPEDLQSEFEYMFEDDEDKPAVGGVVETMTDWPDKGPDDVGWVYISISTPEFLEAITVTVASTNDAMTVSSIEFGRP